MAEYNYLRDEENFTHKPLIPCRYCKKTGDVWVRTPPKTLKVKEHVKFQFYCDGCSENWLN